MFRRFLSLLVLLALPTSLVNRFVYANPFTSSATTIESKKKKCAPCSAGSQNDASLDPIDKLATLGRRTQVQPFMPVQRSVFEGVPVNFVGTAGGQLSFAVTDLALPGAMPLMFQRVYSSDRQENTGLGVGWTFVFDDRITLDGYQATMQTGDGALISFRRDPEGVRFRLQTDAPLPHQSFELINETTITEQTGALTRTYVRVGDTYRLSRIADASGNAITIGFDARGNISRVQSGGAKLSLNWSNDADARLLSVTNSAGQRVAFKQDGKRLRGVTDPAGAQWTYDYEGARLTRSLDPLGRTMLRVRYDRVGRAIEAGDAAGAYLYDYDSKTATPSRLTTVTDPVGAKTYVEHSERGMVTAITDGESHSVRFEYNEANRPARVSTSFGDEMRLTYDPQNRLLRQWSTDGTDKSYGYDERGRVNSVTEGGVRTDYTLDDNGQITAARGVDSTGAYSASYNSRGQLASIKSDKREVAFEYDGMGNKTAFAYSDIGRFSLERDASSRVIRESFPSGLNIYNEYDARGWLTKQSDNRGRSMRVERDASGAPVAYTRGDGKRLSLDRDETSRVVAMTDFNGLTRRYAYDARGAVTDYTNTRGERYKYEYDKRGLLRSILRADGTGTTIERDERGRVRRLVGALKSATQLKTLAHALMPQDDGSGYTGDILVIDVWGPRWTDYPVNGGLLGGGGMYLPMETTGNEGGSGGETRERCIARHYTACDLQFYACLGIVVSGGVGFFATCTLTTLILGLPACTVITAVIGIVGAAACVLNGVACRMNAPDGCPA
jgi:YD repeat-containing protein